MLIPFFWQMIVVLIQNIEQVRWMDTLMAVISAWIIIGFREFIQPKFFRLLHFVLPVEFIVMAISITLSYFLDLHGNYGVIILGNMPFG